ncbi:MAG: hypothetical protein HQK54_16885 [Oligoflexales bacterium]|nr:hypothetical protein [Oligoflexales bacterium]
MNNKTENSLGIMHMMLGPRPKAKKCMNTIKGKRCNTVNALINEKCEKCGQEINKNYEMMYAEY